MFIPVLNTRSSLLSSTTTRRYDHMFILRHKPCSIFPLLPKKAESISTEVSQNHLPWHLKQALNDCCISPGSQVICCDRQVFCMLFRVSSDHHLLPQHPPGELAHTHTHTPACLQTARGCLCAGCPLQPCYSSTLSLTRSTSILRRRVKPQYKCFLSSRIWPVNSFAIKLRGGKEHSNN